MIIKNKNKIINTDNCAVLYISCLVGDLRCIIDNSETIMSPNHDNNEKLLNDIFIAMASGVKYAEIIDGELIPFEGEESSNET